MNKLLSSRFLSAVFALSVGMFAAGQALPMRTAVELKDLQGDWEGDGAGGKCAITIAGNVLHYRAGTNWWKTTFTLPAGTEPQQLHATIKDSSPPTNGVGEAVSAIIKIEEGTLTLLAYGSSAEAPKNFEEGTDKYVVRKVRGKKETVAPAKTK